MVRPFVAGFVATEQESDFWHPSITTPRIPAAFRMPVVQPVKKRLIFGAFRWHVVGSSVMAGPSACHIDALWLLSSVALAD